MRDQKLMVRRKSGLLIIFKVEWLFSKVEGGSGGPPPAGEGGSRRPKSPGRKRKSGVCRHGEPHILEGYKFHFMSTLPLVF